MTTNAELGDWGEPPADADEQVLADFLDTALAKLEAGETIPVRTLLPGPAAVAERGHGLLADLDLMCHAAAAVWQRCGLLPDTTSAPSPADDLSTLLPQDVGLPDPFPGEFRLRRLLGTGGFGQVWLADDLNLGRPVALKTLHVTGPSPVHSEALAALRREARLLGRFQHPNIVQVHTWRTAGDEHYLVMQYVAGGSLADRLKKLGPIPWPQAARYIADVGEGLVEVHAHGIVHRDIKPANILWDPHKDEALLTDFGLSALRSDGGAAGGTPLYMAPEAFDGRVQSAGDVYSLAASLFRLVTGDVPFPAATTVELLGRMADGLPNPDARCRGLPQPIEQVIRAGLAPMPEDRPGLPEFIARLRGALNQLMADTLTLPRATPTGGAAVDLRLLVSRLEDGRTFAPVASSHPRSDVLLRDLKRVPRPPDQVRLQTGDRVRIEVVADRPGYVTVFNVGPTGNLNLLYPEPSAAPSAMPAHRPLNVLDVELTPPAGRERLFALWSAAPLPLRPEEFLSLAERGTVPGSGPYRATRDMARVQASVQRLNPGQWQAVVLELDHRSPQEFAR
jgi:serine/threonine protein kinase